LRNTARRSQQQLSSSFNSVLLVTSSECDCECRRNTKIILAYLQHLKPVTKAIHPWAEFGATAWGARGPMASVVARACNGGLGRSPQQGPGAEPLVGVSGRRPLKLKVFLSMECPK